jgi:hypothetical protein
MVQVIVVAPPFFRTVTTPDAAFTPAAVEVTIKLDNVRTPCIVNPVPIAADVQVVSVTFGEFPYNPSVEDAVTTPVQDP